MADKPTKEQVAFQQQLNDLYKQGAITLKELTSFMADSNKMSATQIRNAKAHFSELKKVTKEKEKQVKLDEDLKSAEEELIDLTAKLNSGIKGNIKEFQTIGDKTSAVVANLKNLIKQQVKSGKLTVKEANELSRAADEAERLADTMQTIANSPAAAFAEDLYKASSAAADKLEALFNKIPGGGMLFKFLGGEQLKAKLNQAAVDGLAVMAQKMQEGKGFFESFGAGFKEFSSQLKAIPNIGMILGIGAAIAAAGVLFKIFQNVSHAAHELSEQTGITYTQAKQLNKEARKAQTSFDNQLATMEDITAVQAELVKGMGSASLVSTEVAANVADTAKAFGVSAETAGQVTKELTMMGMSQQEAADLQLETNAAALKAGVNVAAVQEDIAQNAQTAAAYFGGSGKELAKAAIEAAKMGVSIEQMVKTADGLLDIESSLEKQFRAQALTGKNLNFEKARQLALDGKIEEAQKEMLRQAGTIDEFNAMAPHQRKALAEAMGMEVGELQKSLTLQKMRGKLSEDELAAAAGLNKSADELAKMSAEEIKAELAKKNAADKTAAAFDKIKNELVSALAPAAQLFADIISGLTPVISIIGKALKIAFLPVTLAAKALQAFADAGIVVKGIVAAIGFGLLSNYLMSKNITAEGMTQKGLDAAKLIKTKALNVLKAIGLGTEGGITAEKISQKVQDGIAFAKQTAMNALKVVQLGLQTGYNLAVSAGNALMNTGIGGILKQAGAFLMKAVSGIFATLSQIPFGAGLLLAGGAVAGLFALFNKAKAEKAGDVGIAPKGGPIVASPQEGKIFQGTKNDGVEMSPTAGDPGSGGGGGTTATISSKQMTQIIEALQQIVQGVNNPPPVVIGEGQVNSIGSKISAAKSFIS